MLLLADLTEQPLVLEPVRARLDRASGRVKSRTGDRTSTESEAGPPERWVRGIFLRETWESCHRQRRIGVALVAENSQAAGPWYRVVRHPSRTFPSNLLGKVLDG